MFTKKTFLSFAASALLTLSFSSVLSAAAPSTLTIEGINQQAQQDAGTGTHITLLHTNDVHAHATEATPYMGYAKLSGIANLYREANPNTLLLDAGDQIHGTSFATLVKGESVIQTMNLMGYAAMEPGNHEFDYGYDRLLELSKMANFPIISSNIVEKNGKAPFEPYIIREVDGVKIGIFGLETPETAYKTNPKNVTNIEFTDPTVAAKKMVAELQGKVDVIVALGHLGLDQSSTDTSLKVVKEVPGIDVFIDGHSHTLLENGQTENGTLIASTGEYGEHMGVIDLWVDGGKVTKKQAYVLDEKAAANVTPDPKVAALVDSIQESQKSILEETVAESSVKLDGERTQVRAGETNLGDLLTDAMRKTAGTDVAITNGGGIRASIAAGKVTKGDVITVLPFGNLIVSINVTGAELLAALNNGASDFPNEKGAFTQVSGITYKIDTAKEKGKRVHSVTVGGKPLDLKATYSLATNDFMAVGGDEYTMFKGKAQTGIYGSLDEALIEYMQSLGKVNIKTDGRIAEAPTPASSTGEATTPATPVKPVPAKPSTTKPATPAKPVPAKPSTTKPAKPAKPAPAKPVPAASDVYVVKAGDTLYSIAVDHGTTWKVLRDLNDLTNAHWIYPGQKIKLPAMTATAAS
ncbi:5'-nucleotidase C-terminal domain-containing protein [Paenibacillus kyungheensis]